MNPDIKQLEQRIAELEKWKADKERQQIKYPLDKESIEVLNKYFMRIVDSYFYEGGASSNTFLNLLGKQGDDAFTITGNATLSSFVGCTANVTTNIISIVDSYKTRFNRFSDNEVIYFYYTPDGGFGGVTGLGTVGYYVIDASADGYSFKISATEGGAAIDITSVGSGQYIIRF